MKKLLGVAAILAVLFLAYTGIKSMVESDTPELQPPPATTSAPTVLENLNIQIVELKAQVSSLKGSDTVMQAKLDQIQSLLNQINAKLK
jgi:peptidoglycan hydrolase CwlO-like protein